MALEFTVDLLYDGVPQLHLEGATGVPFSVATVLAGEVAGNPSDNSEFVWDDLKLTRAGNNLLGNSGLESPLVAAGSGSRPWTEGNWRGYYAGSGTLVERVTSPVYAGTYAGRTVGRTTGGAYLYQDLSFVPADPFTLSARVRPVSGAQTYELVWDWDRGGDGDVSGSAVLDLGASQTLLAVWGLNGTAPAIPYGQWTLVELVFDTGGQPGFTIGHIGIGQGVGIV